MTSDQKFFTAYCVLAGILLLSIYPAKLAMVQGVESTIFDLLLGGGDTVYASGYSDRGFLRLHPGMSTAEVELILGPPLDIYPIDFDSCCDTGMRWTRIPTPKSPNSRFCDCINLIVRMCWYTFNSLHGISETITRFTSRCGKESYERRK